MNKRDNLRRLPRKCYQSDAVVHWSLTIFDRQQGWLTAMFLYRFRELMTHTMFRYSLACPMFCLMPDHMHMVWMGLSSGSDQLNAMKHFRTGCNNSLSRINFQLQDQSYDHVFQDEERQDNEFQNACEYIARNPERAGLVEVDAYATYRFTGCLIPGYPELRPFESTYWAQFNKIISFLRKDGLMRT